MDKLDLIRSIIKVAGQCTNETSAAGVCKTICVNLLPNVIDFVDERQKLRALQKANDDSKGTWDVEAALSTQKVESTPPEM